MRSGFGLRLELRPCWIERRREYKLNVYVVRTMYFMNSIHFEIEIEPCSSSWPIQTSRYFPCFSCCVLRRVRCRGGPCTDPHSRRQIFPQVNVKTWKSVAYWFVLPSCCLPVAFLLPSCCLPVALMGSFTRVRSPTHPLTPVRVRNLGRGTLGRTKTAVVSVETPLSRPLRTVDIPVTSRQCVSGCARTRSTCSASTSGSRRRARVDALCADRHGNSRLQKSPQRHEAG